MVQHKHQFQNMKKML